MIWVIFGLLGPPGGPRGPSGVFGGSGEPKIFHFHTGPILTLRCHVLGQNNLSHYAFDILGQIWALRAKKRPFRAKIGYMQKWDFLKNTVSNFAHISPKWLSRTIINDDILIFWSAHQKNFTTADFVILDPLSRLLGQKELQTRCCHERPQMTLKHFPRV